MTEDKKLEELKMAAHPFILLYQYIYEKMAFVEGLESKTSATATVFISTKDEWKSIEYKREQEARKRPSLTPVQDPGPSPNVLTPVPEFKTAHELSKPAPPTQVPMTPEPSKPEAQKTPDEKKPIAEQGEMITDKQIRMIFWLTNADKDKLNAIKKQMGVKKLEEIGRIAASSLIEELDIQKREGREKDGN